MIDGLSREELLEIEKQFSCPSGDFGIEMAQGMHDTNLGMISNSIDFLDFQEDQKVLELGHGSCRHLDLLLAKVKDIEYYGLEISETMKAEAEKLNSKSKASFQLYDGENIPFETDSFDLVLTVNTIYFWSNPEKLFSEIGRVLKPGGLAVITYGTKEFLKDLPFVGDRFRLYGEEDIRSLILDANLEIMELRDKKEKVTLENFDRAYTLMKLRKSE